MQKEKSISWYDTKGNEYQVTFVVSLNNEKVEVSDLLVFPLDKDGVNPFVCLHKESKDYQACENFVKTKWLPENLNEVSNGMA